MKKLSLSQLIRTGVVTVGMSLAAVAAQAAGSVGWLSPANGSSYPVGTNVAPTGQANAKGSIGGGLDLILVLDSSGSMTTNVSLGGGITASRQQLQKDAANALVTNLPAGTNVGVVDFDGSATLVQGLTDVPANLGAVQAAINGVDASGGTNIELGINRAKTELDANGSVGSSKQILVISDGSSSGNPTAAAAAALAAGYTVNTVAFPGASIATMQNIATAGGGTFVNFSNNPQDIVDIFSGAGGGVLVGVQSVEITDPDGNTYFATVDAVGNFVANGFNLNLGANIFNALATFTDTTTANAQLTLYGTKGGSSPVPLPASALLLMAALGGLGVARRRS